MINAIIIEDEAHIRNTLSRMLIKFCPQAKISGEADGVKSGIDAIHSMHPNLVFLDIHLADGTAFDLLNAFDTIDFKVIFISSFDKRLIQAFQFSGLDYLQKPFNPNELNQVVSDALQPDLKNFQLRLDVLKYNLENSD